MSGSAEFTAPSAAEGQRSRQSTSRPSSTSSRSRHYQWLLVALCFMVVVADGMDVAIMGFVTPSILQEWNISRPAFGIVISAAPFGLVVGALVAGPSSDRFGRKPVLVVSVLIMGLADARDRMGVIADRDGDPAFPRRNGHGRRDAERLDAPVGICASAQALVDDHDHVHRVQPRFGR